MLIDSQLISLSGCSDSLVQTCFTSLVHYRSKVTLVRNGHTEQLTDSCTTVLAFDISFGTDVCGKFVELVIELQTHR